MSTTDHTPNKAIGYLRVSTNQQATEGVSLDSQRLRVEAWAVAHGFELVGIFEDAGLSGSRSDNRPELNEALDLACSEGAALVVYSLSRLTRSTADAIRMADRLSKAGADLVSLSESIDTTSASGRMVFGMLAVLAQFERDLTGERTAAAMAHKKARMEFCGGRIPFGFELAPDEFHLQENATEQKVLGMVRQLRASGLSYRKIGAELVARGINPREGAKWSPNSLRTICLQEVAA